MTGDSTVKGPTCARCGLEIGGCWISEGHLSYHPACAPSNHQPQSQPLCIPVVVPSPEWDTEKADAVARLSKALGVEGPVTLDGLLTLVEKRLPEVS